MGNPQMGCRASPQRARGPSPTLGFTDQRSYTGNVSHQNVWKSVGFTLGRARNLREIDILLLKGADPKSHTL